jgi:hypothetical protein
MWRKGFESFKHRLKTTPTVAVASSSAALLLISVGVLDYNRPLVKPNKLVRNENDDLGEVLENYHNLVYKNCLTLEIIRSKADYCDETQYIYERALKRADYLRSRGTDEEAIREVISTDFSEAICRMTRRALLRNGHLIKWWKAVVQDEFLAVFVFPTLMWLMRMVKVKK